MARKITTIVPALISLAIVLSFVISAAREWVYFLFVDEKMVFFAAPSDYVTLAIHWLPEIVLGLLGFAFIEMVTARIEGFQSEDEIVQRATNPARTAFYRALPYNLFLAISILGGFAFFVFYEPTYWHIMMFGSGIWIVFFLWFSRHPRIHSSLTRPVRLLLSFGPMFVFWAIGDGYKDAMRDLTIPYGEYRIVHKDGEIEENAQLLRVTSEGIIFLRVDNNQVSFLAYPALKRIDRVKLSEFGPW